MTFRSGAKFFWGYAPNSGAAQTRAVISFPLHGEFGLLGFPNSPFIWQVIE
jgi:hypothetical protein